jgi:hypothetical protein
MEFRRPSPPCSANRFTPCQTYGNYVIAKAGLASTLSNHKCTLSPAISPVIYTQSNWLPTPPAGLITMDLTTGDIVV